MAPASGTGPDARRRASAAIGLAALLALLLAWKSYGLRSDTFRVQEQWSRWTYLAASAQDAFAWCALAVAWSYGLRRWRRGGLLLLLALAEALLLLQVVDARLKVRLLHPLSCDWIRFGIRELDTLGADWGLLAGERFWIAGLATLAALAAAFAVPFAPGTARLARLAGAERPRARLALAAAAIGLGAATFVLPAQPYGLHKNFVTDALLPIATRPSGLRDHAGRPTDEPVRASAPADFASSSDASLAVARGCNVVVYVLESTAFEQTSLASSGRDTTPFLRELVEAGAASAPCYAQVANSAKATFALFSGLYASTTMEVLECGIERAPGLARTLRERGYHTAFVSPQPLDYQGQRTMFKNLGFDEIASFFELRELARERGLPFPERGPVAADDEMLFLWDHERLPRIEPFLVAYYTQSTHYPYRTPTGSGGRTPAGRAAGSDEQSHARALRYSDDVLRRIVELHRSLGVHERTLYVITADHGEDFVGGAFAPRNSSLAENGHRVPLVIYVPGADLRGRGLPLARHVDLAPTVLDLLGLAPAGMPLQGRSLLDRRCERPIFLGSYGAERVLGLVEGGRKWGFDAGSRSLRVVDLAADPSGRAWRPVAVGAPGGEAFEVVRRLEEFDAYNEALLRDLAERR
jgi:hypothetical protein